MSRISMHTLEASLEEVIYKAFAGAFGITEVDWGALAEFSNSIKFSKNGLIKRAYETEKHLYYILKGSAGSFSHKQGKRVCVELCYEKEFFGDYVSLLSGSPSPLETQCLENSLLIRIPFSALLGFYKKQDPIVLEKIGRLSAEFLLFKKQEQLLDLQTLTAEERYRKLLAQRPDLLQRTALKHIASYLNITPESFSRIRKEIR